MCLILLAYKVHPRYPLIIAANRDEYYHRATRPLHWWQNAPHLLAGQDLEQGGTWLGFTKTGKFAAVTNVREPQAALPPVLASRGTLPLHYLTGHKSEESFRQQLEQSRHHYAGYNLLYGRVDNLAYYSNRQAAAIPLVPGFHGLSNAALDTPWPKVVNGLAELAQCLSGPEIELDRLMQILDSTSVAEDTQLPQTGVSLAWERTLSAICIQTEGYGTRSSCVATLSRSAEVQVMEKQRAPDGGPLRCFRFSLA